MAAPAAEMPKAAPAVVQSAVQAAIPEFSVIVPCYNEIGAIEETLHRIRTAMPQGTVYRIIVVNDGSTDGTAEVLKKYLACTDLQIVEHSRNRGYGAALKSGIRAAHTELIAIIDADGTYPSERLPELVSLCANYDMVVGARMGPGVTYSKLRSVPKYFLRWWMSWIARQDIPDINSGMRVFRKSIAERFFGILPDTFSFTVTITLAMLTNYHTVLFTPITYQKRLGKSKIKPVRDTLRFIFLILRTGVYFAPVRVFGPLTLLLFILSAVRLLYDIFILADITDTTVLLILFSLNAGMLTLVVDMIDKRSVQ